jgi:6-phosphogluconolactonase
MKIEVLADAEAVALRAAEVIAADARSVVAVRGRFVMAVSGGATPWAMLRALAGMNVPWAEVHLVQVDERIAPAGDPARNWSRIEENLVAQVSIDFDACAMPVEAADIDTAAAAYAATLRRLAGSPAVLDLVHLGLGVDGHTASLVPNDPVLEVDGDVGLTTGLYEGCRRMTLTYPALDRARHVLWLVTGADKAAMLARLVAGDRSIPAGRVCQDRALLLADVAATAGLG